MNERLSFRCMKCGEMVKLGVRDSRTYEFRGESFELPNDVFTWICDGCKTEYYDKEVSEKITQTLEYLYQQKHQNK